MTTTESPVPSTPDSPPAKAAGKVEKVAKVDKPDEEKFKKDVAEAEKQLNSITDKLSALRIKIDGASGKGPNSARITQLRTQLDQIKEKQAQLKSGKSGVQQQLDTLKAKIEREQNDLRAKRGKFPFRSIEEVDREISNLEKEVDSGKLKLVDEKKNLKKISDLKATKKHLAVFTSAEESIKSDIAKRKKLQDELSSSTQTPEAKALSEEFNKVREELAKLKEENDSAFAKRGELRSQRDELQKQRDKAYESKKAIQDEYYKQLKAHREWSEQTRKAQSERYWKQREEEERQRLASNASRRLEEASQEAFATEIWKCENLLRLFKGETTNIPTAETKSSILAAPAVRTVENVGLTKIVSKKNKEADEFLAGVGKKKNAAGAKKAQPKATQKPKGFVLSMDVMQNLGDLGVSLPVNEEAVKTTVEQLKEKLEYFKENQERVTQENIAKAKKDNEEIERKAMAAFNDKKEHDLSGRRGPVRKSKPASDRKSGKPKESKVNGNTEESKAEAESGVETDNGEKDETTTTEA